jgi:hypothetical protein
MIDTASGASALATVSRRATEQAIAHWLYRRETTDPFDSGWRIFAGDESKSYCANPDNFQVVSIRHVVLIVPALADVLDEPVGTALEWDDDMDGYRRVQFTPPPD